MRPPYFCYEGVVGDIDIDEAPEEAVPTLASKVDVLDAMAEPMEEGGV